MVKNLSNPLNARKVAKILAEDAQQEGHSISERDISVFLSDHRISDLQTAIKQLKQEQIIPEQYSISEPCQEELLEAGFIDESYQVTSSAKPSTTPGLELLGDINTNSIEFKTQLESLKNKLLTSWSGGISIEGHELDNFDRKFGRPMNYFKDTMARDGIEVSDLQAFAVVYATDHLSLGDNSKEEVYYLMFDRFDQNKEELEKHLGFHYSWPKISGTSFIDMGKKFTIGPELAEFAKRFRGISGLDTYPDEVIQVFFFNLITGPLIDEMIAKNILFRWSDETTTINDPFRWLLPPPDFNMDRQLRDLLVQTVIVHTLLVRIEAQDISLIDLLLEVKDMASGKRSAYLSKRVEAALTRKSVALQFGTTLANFFENFRTNPAKVTPFLDTTLRYFTKTANIETLLATIEHSIRTGLKNSTGIIKRYLKNISDEDLVATIHSNLNASVNHAIKQTLPEFEEDIIQNTEIDYEALDRTLRSLNDGAIQIFFSDVLAQAFGYTTQFAKNLEPQKAEPVSTEGGLSELTQDFMSTIKYHGSQNWKTKNMINSMVENDLPSDIAEMICYGCSYITYQVASKEGSNGEQMMMSMIRHYETKAHQLAEIELNDGVKLKDDPSLSEFIADDLRQAHVLVSLASKMKTDVYNAWTPLASGRAKHTRYINEALIPNLLYWQRLPREFITDLLKAGKIQKSMMKDLVAATNRLSLLEAYTLLVMGTRPDLNSIFEARTYISNLFDVGDDLDQAFALSPRTGEAEIALESIYLWTHLQEVKM